MQSHKKICIIEYKSKKLNRESEMNIVLIVCAFRVQKDYVRTEVFTDKQLANEWYSEKRDIVRLDDKSAYKETDYGSKGISFYTDDGSFVLLDVKH